jgi:hypothetical protein
MITTVTTTVPVSCGTVITYSTPAKPKGKQAKRPKGPMGKLIQIPGKVNKHE